MVMNVQKCLLVYPRFSGNSFYNFSQVARLVGARYLTIPYRRHGRSRLSLLLEPGISMEPET